MEDKQIIDLYFERSEDAIHETQKKYGPYCYKVADNILHNHEDSQECVNDTWMKAWDSIPPARPEKLKLFLAKITRNLSFNKYKAQNSKKRGGGEITMVLDELEECISDRSDVEGQFVMRELILTINNFVRSLQQRDRDIFVRRYFFVDSISDISKRYKISENNVRVILSRSRNKLKKRIEKEGYFLYEK